MTDEEIKSNLCYHDNRNPSYDDYNWPEDEPTPPRKKRCMCDNCFYDRDKLAVEIIRLQES